MFTAVDPIDNTIRLTKSCWFNHIIVEHPIMRKFLDEVRETIKNPDYIYKSKIGKRSQLYFKEYTHKRYGKIYIMVAVKMKVNQLRGYVQTAFIVYNLNKGGTLLWKRN